MALNVLLFQIHKTKSSRLEHLDSAFNAALKSSSTLELMFVAGVKSRLQGCETGAVLPGAASYQRAGG